jgi:hypothetical protein
MCRDLLGKHDAQLQDAILVGGLYILLGHALGKWYESGHLAVLHLREVPTLALFLDLLVALSPDVQTTILERHTHVLLRLAARKLSANHQMVLLGELLVPKTTSVR